MEADLVSHGGESAAGSFVHTLTLTDVASGWTKCVALVVRDGALVTAALEQLRTTMPLSAAGFDTDNGGSNLTVEPSTRLRPLESAWVAVLTGRERRVQASGSHSIPRAPRTRSFGQPPAGLSTANRTFFLPCGALLVLTTLSTTTVPAAGTATRSTRTPAAALQLSSQLDAPTIQERSQVCKTGQTGYPELTKVPNSPMRQYGSPRQIPPNREMSDLVHRSTGTAQLLVCNSPQTQDTSACQEGGSPDTGIRYGQYASRGEPHLHRPSTTRMALKSETVRPHPRMGPERARQQLAPRVLAGTTLFECSRSPAAKEGLMTEFSHVVEATAIRPFQVVKVPDAELAELRRRINATKWPERETVTDASQGVQLATMQALARYWATDYDSTLR